MNITITGRHVEVTPALEKHVQGGIKKIKRFFDGIIDVQAILGVEKRNHMAEINIFADGIHVHGEAKTQDLYKSIDVALSRIQTQILKHKEKIQNHRLRRKPGVESRPLGVKVDVLSGDDVEFGEKNPQIVRTRNYDLKPMSVDEAAMQMDLINQDVLVFMNDSTNRLNVIYRRYDGNYELIAPEI